MFKFERSEKVVVWVGGCSLDFREQALMFIKRGSSVVIVLAECIE